MILRVVLAFAAGLIVYLALAGQASATELAAGAFVALLMAGFAAALHLRQDRPVALSWAAARRFGRVTAALPLDTLRVGVSLACTIVRTSAGTARWTPLATKDPGCRAAEVLGTSLAPNGIVVLVETDRMLVHHLARP